MQAFDGYRTPSLVLDAPHLRRCLDSLARADRDSTPADRQVQRYYRDGGALVWIDRAGPDGRADTLLAQLHRRLAQAGFADAAFGLPGLADGLRRFRALDFDSQTPGLVPTLAALEYGLTKACVRYGMGQRYGFTDPHQLLNHLDLRDATAAVADYRQLFDVDTERPPRHYADSALQWVRQGRITRYFDQCEPTDTLYHRLRQAMLAETDAARRTRLLVNMERRRWRQPQPDARHRLVLVNVAAQQLWAMSPDTLFNMRVVCGAQKTKTPLLTSVISSVTVNPEWNIPMSIIRDDICRHVGDSAYFARNRYFAESREPRQRVAPHRLSADQLRSGRYRVAQESGKGNSLGRLKFNFKNSFDVYLHDTSNHGAFGNATRLLSHGCVRVQRPFDLACFLLPRADERTLDRLRISIDLPPETEWGRDYVEAHADEESHHRLVGWLSVEPGVPVFITYYTVYPDPATGQLSTWPDAYGYDRQMERAIKPFM